MPESAYRALVALELRRVEPQLRRTLTLAAGTALLITLLGWATPGRMAFILLVLGIAGVSAAVMNVVKDKLDGGLEFLVSLPVGRGVLAAARLTAGCILSVAAGVCLTAAFWMASRGSLPAASRPPVAVELFGIITGGTVLSVGLGIGTSLRMRASQFANLVFVGFLAVLVVEKVVAHAIPGGEVTVLSLLGRPWVPRALGVALVLLAGVAGWLAFWLARTGLERFKPERDKAMS